MSAILLALFLVFPHKSAAIPLPSVPPGYKAVLWRAADLAGPTSIAFDGAGRLFVAQVDGRILTFQDLDHDGVADPVPATVFKTGLSHPNGIVFVANKLFVCDYDRVISLQDLDGDGVAETESVIVSGLPVGLASYIHSANGIALGPDGKLYFAVGSTCDQCQETDPKAAAVVRMNLDGSQLEVFASGLRNTFDIAFNSAGQLFGGDNSFNYGAATETWPPDEFNWIRQGKNYGWPAEVGFPAGQGSEAPVCLMPSHCSPDGICFYSSHQFPFSGEDAFLALWGEVVGPPSGHVVQRMKLASDGAGGYAATPENFATGFIHPIDVVTNTVGDLYVADYGIHGAPPTFSAIYRIYFEDLSVSGVFQPGGSATFAMRGAAGGNFLLLGSTGGGYIPMGFKGVFRMNPNFFYQIVAGTFPASGESQLTIPIPNIPGLTGLTFHHQLARLFPGTFYLGVDAPLPIGP